MWVGSERERSSACIVLILLDSSAGYLWFVLMGITIMLVGDKCWIMHLIVQFLVPFDCLHEIFLPDFIFTDFAEYYSSWRFDSNRFADSSIPGCDVLNNAVHFFLPRVIKSQSKSLVIRMPIIFHVKSSEGSLYDKRWTNIARLKNIYFNTRLQLRMTFVVRCHEDCPFSLHELSTLRANWLFFRALLLCFAMPSQIITAATPLMGFPLLLQLARRRLDLLCIDLSV